MFWSCSVWSCQSDLSTQIGGRQIKFYPYPKDKTLQEHWKTICKKVSHVKDNNFFRLCELHFEKRYITKDLSLKPNAVPSVFEDLNRRKVHQNLSYDRNKTKGSSNKKIKVQGPNSSSEVTKKSPLQNQRKSPKLPIVHSRTIKNSLKTPVKSKTPENSPIRYRLVIDIDKISQVSIKTNDKSSNNIQRDAIQKRKRKETNVFVKNGIEEDEENFRYLDENVETEKNSKIIDISDDSCQEEEKKIVKKLRFSGQNINTEVNQIRLQPSSDSVQKLKFSDQNIKANQDRLQSSNKKIYFSSSDQNKTTEPEQKRMQISNDYHEKEEKKDDDGEAEYSWFSDQNEMSEDILQSTNDLHQAKNEVNDVEEEEDEEMEEEYLIFSDQNETIEENDHHQTLSEKCKNLWSNADDNRCKNGCALEKIICDENISFKCMNCNNIYNVINKSQEEISNNTFCLDKTKESNDRTTRMNLSESKKCIQMLSEHLIFTTTGNSNSCGGNCELKSTIWDETKAYKCRNCGNYYNKSIETVVQLPSSVNEPNNVNDDVLSDFFDDDELEDSDDVSSNFWDDTSSPDTEEEEKNLLKKNLNNSKANNDKKDSKFSINIQESLSGCENETHLKVNDLLKISDDILQKHKDKLMENNQTKISKNKLRKAKYLLKELQDKSKNVNDLLKMLKKSKEEEKLLKMIPNMKLKQKNNQTQTLNNKLKKENELLKTPKKSIDSNNLMKIPNNETKKLISLLKTSNDNFTKIQDKFKTSVQTNAPNEIKKTNNQMEMSKNISHQENEIIDLEEENFQCETCNQIFSTTELLINHIKEHFTCDICYTFCDSELKFNSHMTLHESSDKNCPFQCHICDFPFETKDLAKDHISNMHNLRPETQLENLSFTDIDERLDCDSEEETTRHIEQTYLDAPNNSPDSSISKKSKTKIVKFLCNICEMEFSTLEEIEVHTKIHLNSPIHLGEHLARSYQCHKCSKAFIDQISLQTHMQCHEVYYVIQH
ncbi:interaptin-like isoform X2 [Leptopilina boulardi]|uniref:interaptin-like isoform X2 n=1 Tax=Leptopilina boulardi TaxID=63433 RepID=UPI0021F6105C|nr:interaptin-like isoform X2 [Leptopilina boulardi]